MVGGKRDGSPEVFERHLRVTKLVLRHPEKMKRIDVLRIRIEDFPVKRRRLCNLPPLMASHRIDNSPPQPSPISPVLFRVPCVDCLSPPNYLRLQSSLASGRQAGTLARRAENRTGMYCRT